MTVNGHLPEGAVLLTREVLAKAARKHVKLPRASAEYGQDVYALIRPIRRVDYLQFLPPSPPEAESWPEASELRAERYQTWLNNLPETEKKARQDAVNRVTYLVIMAGSVEPMTEDEARDLGDDAEVLAVEILRFSGLLPKVEVAEPAAA